MLRVNHLGGFGGRRTADIGVADPYWANVVLAMHMDDAGLTDLKGHTTVLENAVARSSTQSKFGGYSAYFPGNSHIRVADGVDFELGAGDFTIETWFYLLNYPIDNGGTYSIGLVNKDVLGQRSFRFYLTGTATAVAGLVFLGFSTNTQFTSVQKPYSFSLNTWYHIAVSRIGNMMYLFANGALIQATGESFSRTIQDTSTAIKIGSVEYDGGTFHFLDGYMDDVRITKGVGRYSANFTAPTAAFPSF